MHKNLPDPKSFSALVQGIPHFGSDYWHGIFEHAQYRKAAEHLERGGSLVTDLDFTAYHQDAGFGLLDAAIHTGLLTGDTLKHYRKLFTDYELLPAHRPLDQKTADELKFYTDTLRIFSGFRLADLQNLSHRLWFEKIPGFALRHPLVETIYPEMAYLFALAHRHHDKSGCGIVAVTASPNFAVAPALNLLSIIPNRLCSMDLVVNAQGVITSEIPRIVHGARKVDAAKTIFQRWDFATGDNPRNDRAFLAEAEHCAFGIGDEMAKMNGKKLENGRPIVHLPLAIPPRAR